MYSEQDLTDAVASGVVPAEAAEGLRRFVSERRATPGADEEQVRLVTSFNDIFVALAGAVLLIATGQLLAGLDRILSFVAVAGVAWGLAEYFTRERRMALPSILFLAAFASGVFGAMMAAGLELGYTGSDSALPARGVVAVAGLTTALACGLHWRRFHVPITIAVLIGGIITTIAASVAAALGLSGNALNPVLLALGFATFALAMRWDASDVARTTRRSDVAFWLHLLAAPLIVHALFGLLGVFGADANADVAVLVVLIYVALAMVALVIDRRALMVSALFYVLYAIYTLLNAGGVGASFALTGILIGSALLLLSALWQTLRRPLVGRLPERLRARVPPAKAVAA